MVGEGILVVDVDLFFFFDTRMVTHVSGAQCCLLMKAGATTSNAVFDAMTAANT